MKTLIIVIILTNTLWVYSQQEKALRLELTLNDVIELATDSSLNAFIAENMFLAGHWSYKNYKAKKLPFVDLSSSPVDFNRLVTKQYNFSDLSYHYVDEQTLNAEASLSLTQNLTATGGKIYLDTDVGRLDNLKTSNPSQYSATLFRLGYQQNLFGFNPYKWESKIEPLKYDHAKKEFIESRESIALQAVDLFFAFAEAQISVDISFRALSDADTLYAISQKRFKLGSVLLEDLYTLELELTNSMNDYRLSLANLRRIKMQLKSFLRLSNEVDLAIQLPNEVSALKIDPITALKYTKENNPNMIDFQTQLLESEKNLDHSKKESRLNASLDASFGLNQTGSSIPSAYSNPLDQEIVRLSFNVPIIDWGLAKGKFNLMQRTHAMLELQLEQSEIDLDQHVILTVEEFNMQESLVKGAAKADTIAQAAYDLSLQRFLLGNIDLTKLNAVHLSSIAARRTYIQALKRYWRYYYEIRHLTLHDFERNKNLSHDFDAMMGL